MSGRLLIISLILMMLSPLNSFSENSENKIKGPLIVTSETLTADNKARTALFDKNVIAKTNNMTLYADTMLVRYKQDSDDVFKIEATGNVKLLKDSRLITSHEAIYYAEEDKVVFTGEPRAIDGKNVITGTKMTFFLKDDRSYVENSKVFLKE